MSAVIAIAGFGSGVSKAVATKFGKEGFKLALLSRTQAKLDAAAAEYEEAGIVAKGFSVDLSDFENVKATMSKIRKVLGPVTILFWNPYGGPKGFLEATEQDLLHEFKVDVTGLIAAVQALHEDLKAQPGKAAVLVTGGGATQEEDSTAQFVADAGWSTFALAKSAQRRFVHVANRAYIKDEVYVAQVTIYALVKGTPFDNGTNFPRITPEAVADVFWDLYSQRDYAVWDAPAAP